MTIYNQIKNDMVHAIKNKETDKLTSLRTVLGEFSRKGKDLSDDEAINVLRKMLENAKLWGSESEVQLFESYLPRMFDREETKEIVSEIIDDNEFSSVKDMGDIMKVIKRHENTNQIDKKIVSNIVREFFEE